MGCCECLSSTLKTLDRLLRKGLPQRLNEGQDHRCDTQSPAHESNVKVNGSYGRTASAESLILFLSAQAKPHEAEYLVLVTHKEKT